MSSAYEVDPDALFSDEEDEPVVPSPKRARVIPVAPRAPSLGGLKLPSYGNSNRMPAAPPSNQSYSSHSSRSSVPSNPNPYSRIQNSYSRPANSYSAISRPPYGRGRGGPYRGPPSHNQPYQPSRSYGAPGNSYNDQPRGPMGRGRAATLPAHITRANQPPMSQPQQPVVKTQDKIIEEMASILPEADREKFIQEKKKEMQAAPKRKLPSSRKRRQRPDEQSTKKILANTKNSRKGNFKGLDSLLKAAKRSNTPLAKVETSKHRMHKPEKTHAVYAEATMTKEMIEREEREKRQREIEMEEEKERIHMHFREMRQKEKEDREWLIKKWKKIETVASGMRHAYRLARHERALFAEDAGAKCRSLERWGLTLLPVEEDEKVTELLTIHVEEI